VWTIDSSSYASNGPAVLEAHDASNVATTLYSSATNASRDSAGIAVKFIVPTVANGKVYVGAGGEVDIYGLLNGVTQTAAPSITPGTESYNGTLSVTITDATPNASIYYTTDGTSASSTSTLYTGPISVSSSETIKAIASATGLLVSAQSSATYSNVSQTSAVTFSVPTGTYASAQTVSLSDATANATIYYTTNGSTPTTASTVYTTPLTVSSTETISALAVAPGLSNSPVISQTYTVQSTQNGISFNQGFAASAGLMILNGYAALNDARLQLTNGQSGEAGSAWFHTAENIQSFTTDFTFQLSNPLANGITFAIENAPQNVNALGGNGLGLGYSSIANSMAIKFDFFTPVGTGTDSTGLYVNGATPSTPAIDLSQTPINLLSDDTMAVHLVYDGTTLSMTITDLVTAGTYSTSWAINIPSTIGTNTAYVGFTGSTGSKTSSQKILTWSFNSGTTPVAAATPTFSPVAGTYTTAQTVTISDTTSGATIYYTTNGTTPTTTSTKYSAPIAVSATETLEAIAVATGASNSSVGTAAYTISTTAATPVFSPAAGTYASSQQVTISDATSGATIYFTTNGATPTTSSTVYTGAITVGTTETLKAIAVVNGSTNSAVATAAYTINLAAAAPPTFSPAAGSYAVAQTVTISDTTTGATIYYTTNGAAPTTSSTLYSGPITVAASETIKAIAVASGFSTSATASGVYTITAPATPTFTPAAGTYASAQTVTISDTTAGATIYYTTDGSAPTTSSTKYTAALTVSATETVKAIAVSSGSASSLTASAAYTIGGSVAATPVYSPAPGTYIGAKVVTISDATPGATIYYVTGNNTPNTSSTVYTGPITIGSSTVFNAIAVASGYATSPVAKQSYSIVGSATPTPTISPAAGTYTSAQTVTISDSSAGATIYYTTNGLPPTTTSAVYTGPITVGVTETVKAIALAASGSTTSAAASAAYTINLTTPAAATPTFSVPAGSYATAQSVTISDATAGVTIYYTTNGTVPTTASPVYSGPVIIGSTETLSAIAAGTGFSTSPVASAAYTIQVQTPTINLSSGFASAGNSIVYNGSAGLNTSSAQLTSGGSTQAGSFFYKSAVNVSAFTTDFVFQQTNATADGMTFAIQNAPSNVNALGGNGAGLGWISLPKSVAVKFDLFSNAGEGNDSTGIYQGGVSPTTPFVDLSSTGINLHSGDVMGAHIVYDGTTLTLTITDKVTSASYTTSWPINIPSAVGASTAYVGFTGSTGSMVATQNVLTWTYTVN
jgi:hypothetical protein